MPEYSSTTLTPTDATKVPAMQDSNAGNFQLDALKAYILSQAGLANGLATLDAEGKLDSSQIPVNLDDVLVYPSYASLPATGETGKLYITMDVNGSYYWNGTSYQPLGNKAANYRGTVSTLPSNPHNADWFIAKTTFTDGGVTYTAGHIYLYDEAGAKWDDETNNFGQFVLKSQISQTIGNEADLIPSNAAVNSAINAINTRVTNIEDTLIGENEVTVQYPDDGNYSSLMPNKVPSRALKFAEVPRFRGKSRAWNQLANPANNNSSIIGAGEINGITVTYDSTTKKYHAQGTASAYYDKSIVSYLPHIGGHKYLIYASGIATGNTASTRLYIYGSGVFSALWNGTLDTASNSGNANIYLAINNGTSVNFDFQIVERDLTFIFPEGVPSTVAECVAKCPDLLKFDAYDAGSLVDTVVSGAEAIGFNRFDEDIEMGIIGTDGNNYNETSGTYWRSKNRIPCNGLESFYYKIPVGYTSANCIFTVFEYDANGTFLNYNSNIAGLFTTKANTKFMRFVLYFVTPRSTAPEEVCINISQPNTSVSPHNGDYVPYKSDTLSLSEPVTLRSAGEVADTDELNVEVNGVAKRRQTQNIASYTFTGMESGGVQGAEIYIYLGNSGGDHPINGNNILMAEWLLDTWANVYNGVNEKTFTVVNTDTGAIGFYSASITTLSQLQSALSGKTIYYALATPSVTLSDPVPDNFLEVEGGGTVDTIQTQTPVIDNCLDVTYDVIPQ